MSELKDPAIKLFGKTILLLHPDDVLLGKSDEQQPYCSGDNTKNTTDEEHATSTSSGINEDPKTPTPDNETSSKNTPKSEEKPQKPDKILPCPRCNSMDTKFCYYNNYNVNQPRHFCKNCQRYWTAGGTMRNTPVGSGRRKNKSASSASYYRHVIVNEARQGPHSVLNFGSDVSLCESMNSTLNFSDKSQKSQKSEDDHSSFSSNSTDKSGLKNFQGYPLQVPCFPAPPWPVPPTVPPMNHGQSGYPVSLYWGTPWGMSWVTPQNDQCAPSSPLGKHSRDGCLLSPSSRPINDESLKDKDCVLTPKTLRINNPDEAAKSPLWSTLGISINNENNNNNLIDANLCKAFQSKGDAKNEVADNSLVSLQANPAALSRSLKICSHDGFRVLKKGLKTMEGWF